VGQKQSFHLHVYLQSKYRRRIERFKTLKNHQGKVIFIRAAYIHSTVDLNRYYTVPENIEISEEYALKLHHALEKYFPDIDFSLIVVNNHDQQNIIKKSNSAILY